jgi:hypothetical protein
VPQATNDFAAGTKFFPPLPQEVLCAAPTFILGPRVIRKSTLRPQSRLRLVCVWDTKKKSFRWSRGVENVQRVAGWP